MLIEPTILQYTIATPFPGAVPVQTFRLLVSYSRPRMHICMPLRHRVLQADEKQLENANEDENDTAECQRAREHRSRIHRRDMAALVDVLDG